MGGGWGGGEVGRWGGIGRERDTSFMILLMARTSGNTSSYNSINAAVIPDTRVSLKTRKRVEEVRERGKGTRESGRGKRIPFMFI